MAIAQKWYVIQTLSGQENKAIDYIRAFVEDGESIELFVPQRRLKKCYQGKWCVRTENILSGYVFVVTDNPNRLAAQLTGVPAFTRLLKVDEVFVPLADEEVAFLNAFTRPGERIIDMSEGIIEGDEVVILNGPLAEHVAQIKKIDRHKRIAYLGISILGREKLVKVGLEIVHKRS